MHASVMRVTPLSIAAIVVVVTALAAPDARGQPSSLAYVPAGAEHRVKVREVIPDWLALPRDARVRMAPGLKFTPLYNAAVTREQGQLGVLVGALRNDGPERGRLRLRLQYCYEPNNRKEPDLLWDLDLYARLDLADAWAIIGPVNWYGPSSTLKLLFDRLVCASGGNPREDLIDHKDPERAMALERSDVWRTLSRNHLEGRTAAFFSYGDAGADEVGPDGRPRLLQHAEYFDPRQEPFESEREAYAPLVWQCRYSGIEVPDDLWSHAETGVGVPYSANQAEHMAADAGFLDRFDRWVDGFHTFVDAKGTVPPGEFRAYGYEAPGHRVADAKLKWRSMRMSLGVSPADSSPGRQQALGLNRDATFHPKRSEPENQRLETPEE